jgi:hypothetical protein
MGAEESEQCAVNSAQISVHPVLFTVHRTLSTASGDAGYVGGVESFGALLALEFDGFAFIERLVAVHLDGGKMDEDIFTAGTLNESVALGSIEPFHDTLLFHTLSPWDEMDPFPSFFTPDGQPATNPDA